MPRLRRLAAIGVFCTSAHAEPAAITTPDTASPIAVAFLGETFVSHGLVGAGRQSSALHDFHGDSLGSFSSIAVAPGWRRNAGGSYRGGLLALPDRGFNAQLINLIDPGHLARIGLTTDVTPLNPTVPTARLSEKWEGMALAPVLEPKAPDDYFLFVSNDNDFLTPTGCAMPGAGDCNGKVENDNMVLVWRVTLPTFGREN
jgi:hypothetical protein